MEPTGTPPPRTPGEVLRDLRKLLAPPGARTLSQARLAERMGYNEEYLQSFESGRRPMQPHFVDEMARLADDAKLPQAFNRLIEELRAAVAAQWAGLAQPAVVPEKEAAPASVAPNGGLAGKLDALDGKVDGLRGTVDAFSAKTEGRLDGLGGKLDRAEGTLGVLGGKLDTAAARTEGQLHGLAAKVEDAGDEVARTGANVESSRAEAAQAEQRVTRKIDLAVRLLCANLGLGVVRLAVVFVLHCHHAPSGLLPAQPGGAASMGVGQGAAEAGSKERKPKDRCVEEPTPPCARLLGADASNRLDKKSPEDKWVSPEPLEGQRRPPCDEGLGQEAIGGGCWFESVKVKPPCGRLYRKGDRCYVPIAADPKQPVGGEAREVTPEHPFQ